MPFVGAYVLKDKRGPMNCSIHDHGGFCLFCVASSEWDPILYKPLYRKPISH